MKKITFFLFAFAVSFAFAQNNNSGKVNPVDLTVNHLEKRTCGTMEGLDFEAYEDFKESIAPHVAAYLQSVNDGGSPEAVYTIPTIVHIIHNSSEGVGVGRNIPNARIWEQITILNNDFRRNNADAVNTPTQFTGVAADCEINFCLITRYPSGHSLAGQVMPETGVDRADASTLSNVGNAPGGGYTMNTINLYMKPATSWNSAEVMNIWVCQLQSGLLGFATFPATTFPTQDGTVMGYQYFGNTTAQPYHKGRTTTHEVGHWLGVSHIWGSGGCGSDDGVSDTPLQSNSTGGCPNHPSGDACSSAKMFMNYMDYTNDACMNLFTNGQKAIMQATMSTQIRRSTLSAFSTTLCAPTGIDDARYDYQINIFPNPAKDVINVVLPKAEKGTVQVYNLVGEVVYQKNMRGIEKLSIDLGNQSIGVYFVKVKTADKTITKKVMLTK